MYLELLYSYQERLAHYWQEQRHLRVRNEKLFENVILTVRILSLFIYINVENVYLNVQHITN